MNSNKQAVEAAVQRLMDAADRMVNGYSDEADENRKAFEATVRAELARPLEVAASVTDELIGDEVDCSQCGGMCPKHCCTVYMSGFGSTGIGNPDHPAAASRAPVALGAVPVAWAVYWGVSKMQKNSVYFERKTAEEVAATIKSGAEIRPLYTQPPRPQDAAPPAQGDAKDAEPLYRAAIDCGHSIDADEIILRRNPNLPGNALRQLSDRLNAAILATSSKGGAA